MMFKGSALDFFVLVGYIVIGAVVGAVFLKAACALFNMLAGASGEMSDRSARRATAGESSTDITTAPSQKRLPAAGEDWPDYVNLATLPGVPRPSFERAMAIVFVVALGNLVTIFILHRLSRLAGQVGGSGALFSIPLLFICYPLGFLILSGTIKVMLPTSFAKGLLIALLYLFLLGLLLAAIFFVIVLTLGLSALRLG